MANTLHFHVLLTRCRYATAQFQRTRRLAAAGNVIQLTFHGQQRDIADGAQIQPFAVNHQLAFGQLMLQEHPADGFQVVMRRHIHDSQIFVVKLPVRFRAFAITLDQVGKKLEVLADVRIHVHRHKTCELDKARIHQLTPADETARHAADHIVFKPLQVFAGGIIVHISRVDAGIHRSAHQRHAARLVRIIGHGHITGGHQHRHTGLTHRQHMCVRPQMLHKLNQVIDIIIEVEGTIAERYIAGVAPIGDVDLMIRQKLAHRTTQQRSEVAR